MIGKTQKILIVIQTILLLIACIANIIGIMR